MNVDLSKRGENMKSREECIKNIKKIMGNAIKSKMEAEKMYHELSEICQSTFLKERFKFLSIEEGEQRRALKKLSYGILGEEIELPENSNLPLPEVGGLVLKDGRMPVDELVVLLEKVRDVQKKISETYIDMTKFFDDEGPERRLLEYLSYMEEEHYYILGRKIEKLRRFGIV